MVLRKCPQPKGVKNPPSNEIYTDDDGSEWLTGQCTSSDKTPVKIENYSYKYLQEDIENGRLEDAGSRWEIDGLPDTYLDVLSFQSSSSTVNIWDTKNRNDPLKRLRSRDILIAFRQVKTGTRPGKIKSFYIDFAVEPSTEDVLKQIIKNLKKRSGDKFTLSRSSADGDERLTYEMLMDRSKLVGIITLTLTEFKAFAGRDITLMTVKLTILTWGALNWAILGLVAQETRALDHEPVRLVSAALSALVPPLMAWLSYMEHMRSPRTSLLINAFLITDLLLRLIRVRTVWLVFGLQCYTIVFMIATVITAVITVLEALPKSHWQKTSPEDTCPEETSGFYTLLFMSWLNPLILLGNRKMLDTEDLYLLDHDLSADTQAQTFQRIWPTTEHTGDKRLLYVLLRSIVWAFLKPVPIRLAMTAFSFCQPFFIQRLLNHLQSDDHNSQAGLALILASICIYTGLSFSYSTFYWLHYRTVTKIRGVLSTAVFHKATELGSGNLDNSILTLMSNDVQRITDGMWPIHDLWANTLETVLAAWFLHQQLGTAFIAPLLVVLACFLGTSTVSNWIGPAFGRWTKRTEGRVTLTSAVVSNMKPLKIAGLAASTAQLLQSAREDEQRIAGKFRFILTFSVSNAFTPQFIAPVATFLWAGRQLTMAEVFASLSYLTLVTVPLSQLFQRIPGMLVAFASMKRIQDFLEREPRSEYRVFREGSSASQEGHDIAISLENASVGWTEDKWQLRDLNVQFPRSQLTIITGTVAAGKSTLCRALLGEVAFTEGVVRFHTDQSKVGYCDQTPFLTDGSIRSNIIGFEPFDGPLYDEILETVMLKEDLQALPGADNTQTGSGGVTLSGGQKQRVALARALYLNANIYILDDCTVGLDQPTADEVVRRLFGPEGFLRRRKATVVWCTHSLQYLRRAEQVIALGAEGHVIHQGVPDEVLQDSQVTLAMEQDGAAANGKGDGTEAGSKKDFSIDGPPPTKHEDEKDPTRNRNDASVYAYYFGCFGLPIICSVLSMAVLLAFCWNFGTLWLSYWADNTLGVPGPLRHVNMFYLGIYTAIQLLGVVSVGLYIASTDMGMARIGGTMLHMKAVNALVTAPLRYLTKTDQGVIVNLFSQDMNQLDMFLPRGVSNTILSVFTSTGQAIMIAIATPFVAIGYPILVLVVTTIARVYLRTSRQLRLLELENKSPLYTQFRDTVRGIASVRAFGWVAPYIARNHKYLDDSQRPIYFLGLTQVWLALVMNLIVAVVAVSATAFATQISSFSSRAGLVGAGLVSLMQFGNLLNSSVQSWILLETSLGAVKRLKDFGEKTGSEDKVGEDLRPGESWPEKGEIVLKGVDASYEDLEKYTDDEGDRALALKHISMHIRSGEKVAVIGRTGSGKSSLILLLLRLLDPVSEDADKITIDGLPLGRINRETLRRRVIAMPQDMVFLAAGETFKHALDPYSTATEEDSRSALEQVGLWNVVEDAGGLNAEIGKDALSQGQKQLFSLAVAIIRAGLRRRAGGSGGILLLDEVTSTVDKETEKSIMSIVGDVFRGYTVIAVTHRLESVRGFDRVLVMADGKIVKEGSPELLLTENGDEIA